MALVLCLAMALGLLGVISAGAVQSAPKAEESASKVIYATDSKTTYVPAGYTYVYQSTDGRIYTRKATQDTYISGRTLSATEAKALASLSYGAESTITTDDGQTLVCREYDAKEAVAYSDAVKAILSGEDLQRRRQGHCCERGPREERQGSRLSFRLRPRPSVRWTACPLSWARASARQSRPPCRA